jgi:hypothetical protein
LNVTGDPVGAIVNLAVRAHPGIAEPALHAFLTEVLRWNGQVGLVSRRDPIAACERLVLESLELLALVRTHAGDGPHRVADIGSGVPGVQRQRHPVPFVGVDRLAEWDPCACHQAQVLAGVALQQEGVAADLAHADQDRSQADQHRRRCDPPRPLR